MSSQPDTDLPKSIAAPATRALIAAGYTQLKQIAGVPAADLKQLHGMGPKALAQIQEALERQGMSTPQWSLNDRMGTKTLQNLGSYGLRGRNCRCPAVSSNVWTRRGGGCQKTWC
jgi:hypothetical protein